jgi:hypothetical protein
LQRLSIGPQAVAVWCRQLGHEVTYTTYWGQRDPRSLLPSPLDVVFIATYTPSSALAYALAKLFRWEKTLTVIGLCNVVTGRRPLYSASTLA